MLRNLKGNLFIFAVISGLLSLPAVPAYSENFITEDAIVSVAALAGRPVVSISSEYTLKLKAKKNIYFSGQPGTGPFNYDDFLRKFFEDIPEQEFKRMGLGSGVIIDPDGFILTNGHVIEGADKITVTLPDGREFKAGIKGIDPRSDLAVIKIDAANLPVAKLGDSDALKIGQWVVAIGNPFAYAMQNPEPTVTTGVIGALHRSLRKGIFGDRDFSDLIQTDAAINPGNSGGPLVNLKGEVVGINVAIFSTTGGYQGMGFAVPINNAKRVIARLSAGKKIAYGWLGITVQDLSNDLAKYFGMADEKGALVVRILEDGPAAKAGMRERDIIKGIDGKPVDSVRDLLNILNRLDVGRKVKVVVVRDKKLRSLDAVIAERPQEEEPAAPNQQEQPEIAPEKWRGMAVDDLNADIAQKLGIEEQKGVVIVEVAPESPADNAGLVAGDMVLEINKAAVADISEYKAAIKGLRGDCLIRTHRGYFLLKEK